MTSVGLSLLFVLLALILIFVLVARWYLRKQQLKTYQHNVFLITIPKFTDSKEQDKQPLKERLAQLENLFAALAAVKAQRGFRSFFLGRNDHFALEIVSLHNRVSFYAVLPPALTDFFIQQVQSVYPHAHFKQVKDYNIFQPQAAIVSGNVVFGRNYILPIKTYKLFDADPLEALATALSKIPDGSGVAVQFLLRSAAPAWHQTSRQVTQAIYKGTPSNQALNKARPTGAASTTVSIITSTLGLLISSFTSSPKKSEAEKTVTPPTSPRDQSMAKVIEEKSSKPAFDVNIRVVASAPNQTTAASYVHNIMDSFGQYNIYEFGNMFKGHSVGANERAIDDFIFRHFSDRNRVLLNSEEMVSLFHLPENIKSPNIRWLGARQAPPPTELPTEGLRLGYSEYRNQSIDVRIKDQDRRRHVYIIGQTGTGKSTLMEEMALQDIKNGQGVCLIDPHGDLVEKLLDQIPGNRAEDVIVFDPADVSRPLALNMLEFDTPEQKTFVLNELINIFDKLYDLRQTGGPMFEQYMRNTALLMMDDPHSGSTLLEIPKVLSDENFRRYKLSKTSNPVVRDFWEKEAQKAGGEAALANMVPYITSKLTQFVANDILRPIISQQKSSFNFREIMDSQKILLINLSKGKIGDMSSSLLGLICVGKLLMAALSRVDMDEDKRKDFYLYIDEFQNFVTPSIAVILSEARKYHLNLVMAHQYMSQMVKGTDTSVKDAVFGNVGTIVAFRVGVDDAEHIAQQFAPVFTPYDVMNIEKFHAYVRLLIDNRNVPAFSMRIPKPEQGQAGQAARLKEISRLKYGRPRDEIEREILQRTKVATVKVTPLPPIA